MSDKPTMGFSVNLNTKKPDENSHSSNAISSAIISPSPETQTDSPFRIAIMGNFSGQIKHEKKHKFIEVDRDNIEDIISGFDIHLTLQLADNQNIEISIKELNDFHPDSLYEKLPAFEHLRSLQRRLKSKNGFASAAAEIQSWIPISGSTEFGSTGSNSSKTASSNNATTSEPNDSNNSENLLDNILHTQKTTQVPEATQIDQLIKSIISPYVEAATDPRQGEMLAMVDAATQTHMQNILHHPEFQAMESAWQSLHFLIKRLETGTKLKIAVLDISKQQLQDDLSVDNIHNSPLYKLFCDTSAGDLPWSILLGNYQFTDSINDVLTLANMGSIAMQAQAPFISAASETLTGCQSLSNTPDYADWHHILSDGTKNAWTLLRESSVAKYIGLALPRFLLRLPYGEKSKPIETFKFEEMTEENNHEDYLWGNAAFIKTECLARNFLSHGWNMKPGEVFQTDGFPLHYFKEDGETINKPVAEISLTDKGAEIISENGLMPLLSIKNSDGIRSADYRSISFNNIKIFGRWI